MQCKHSFQFMRERLELDGLKQVFFAEHSDRLHWIESVRHNSEQCK